MIWWNCWKMQKNNGVNVAEADWKEAFCASSEDRRSRIIEEEICVNCQLGVGRTKWCKYGHQKKQLTALAEGTKV